MISFKLLFISLLFGRILSRVDFVSILFSNGVFTWFRDLSITIIGVLLALWCAKISDKYYKRRKVVTFYKYILIEIENNLKIVTVIDKGICDKNLVALKDDNVPFVDKSTSMGLLVGITAKFKNNVFDILNKQDLMFILEEDEYKLLFTTYNKFLDLHNYISMINQTMDYGYLVQMGVTGKVISDLNKKQMVAAMDQIKVMCNEINQEIQKLKAYLQEKYSKLK